MPEVSITVPRKATARVRPRRERVSATHNKRWRGRDEGTVRIANGVAVAADTDEREHRVFGKNIG